MTSALPYCFLYWSILQGRGKKSDSSSEFAFDPVYSATFTKPRRIEMLMMVCSSFYLVCRGLASHEERNRKHTTRRAFMFRNVMPTYLCCRYIYLLFDCEKCTQPERTVFVSRMWLNNKINNIIVILHLYLTCIVGRSCILLLVFLGRPSSAHMRLCVFVFMATGYVWDEDIGYIIMCVQQWRAFTTLRVVL